jgi:SnoaL-like domain
VTGTTNDADVAVARRYADAYAAFDVETLRAVLDPDLRFRQINPGGYLALDTARAYIDATADFLTRFTDHAAASSRAEPVGDRFATGSRMILQAGNRSYVMEHQEIVTVLDGRVVAIDRVCTGARPA